MLTNTFELRVGICHCSHGFFKGYQDGKRISIRGQMFRARQIPLPGEESEEIELSRHGCHAFLDLHDEVYLLLQRPARLGWMVIAEGGYTGDIADPVVAMQPGWFEITINHLANQLTGQQFRDWIRIVPDLRPQWIRSLTGKLVSNTN